MGEVYGRQPVLEAFRSGKEINRLLIARGQRQGSIRAILALAKEQGVVVQEVERTVLDSLTENANHQGVLAQIAATVYLELEDLLAKPRNPSWAPFLVLLDGIQDPHNLGSIIRSSEAMGVDGVIIPKRRAVAVTETVMKSSAGAANYVPICRVGNLAVTIETLKEAGYWIIGADMAGDSCFAQDLAGPIALVIGGEGSGLSRLVKEKCDLLSSVPMRGQVNSLNASVAAAVLMFEVVRQRSCVP
ncbi:MAG: 23S rRNA (guanosine(2251)-2'-O)-methyltransferase RlmB [Bacillota bacterium]|nr:23S rRNA (guanosine(2251)-2'-O)-methyltransferase RlmB [Bacillota bacterium]HHT89819.1 23S rRNA (guanosine(2251)-2'-O)-methyltransferase RlmB [Bacillota bacterium]